MQIFIFDFYKERFYKHQMYDSNLISFDNAKDDITKLIKNIKKISFTSNNRLNDFISNHKILLFSIIHYHLSHLYH